MKQAYQQIVVALDGSTEAEVAFEKALEIATRNHGKLILTHVIDSHAYAAAQRYDRSIKKRLVQDAEKLLGE